MGGTGDSYKPMYTHLNREFYTKPQDKSHPVGAYVFFGMLAGIAIAMCVATWIISPLIG